VVSYLFKSYIDVTDIIAIITVHYHSIIGLAGLGKTMNTTLFVCNHIVQKTVCCLYVNHVY
jgi:hypothetical protein